MTARPRNAAAPTSGLDALLIDLDGTLLDIDIDRFLQSYIPMLASRFDGVATPEQFAGHLFGATQATIDNEDPARTNEEVFFDDFCRRLGQPISAVYPVIERFYAEDFPSLSCWGEPYPHVRDVIAAARKRDLKLVLATQPVFPLTAVEERLEWCGLVASNFDLITTAENMHFCKPSLDYYLEIVSKTGCSPDRCLMAGNDVQEDICAARAGMSTFLVEGYVIDRGGAKPAIDYRGSLRDLAELINNGEI